MKIQTFSIIAGSEACNARCPFCISKMTPPQGLTLKTPTVNWRNFRIGAQFAKQCGVTTAMLTGKGEPTLFPDQITQYLEELQAFHFSFLELQTNGILLYEQWEKYVPYLKKWYVLGMTMIAISLVHYDPEKNREVYVPYKKQYIDLPVLIARLHELGFSVRLTCILADGYIDSVEKLEQLIAFAKENKVEQLKISPVNKPEESRDSGVEQWTDIHFLKQEQVNAIHTYLQQQGTPLMKLAHGALVYDVHGQNVCMSYCLTLDPEGDIRQLIFFPDGHLRYDWQYKGAVLL